MISRNSNNIFNVDFVGAKTGKKLTKFESMVQYLGNLLLSRLFQLFILCGVILIFYAIVKAVIFVIVTDFPF